MKTHLPMKIRLRSGTFLFVLFASTALARPAGAAVRAIALQSPEGIALPEAVAPRGRGERSLESLRAGRIESRAPISTEDRTALLAAEAQSLDLSDLRAGYLTDHEWALIGIGAAVVLLIVLL